jgi:hypothetical protein
MTPRHGFCLPAALLAAVLLSAAGPAAGAEVPYLMYSKGTEGKTVPIRVLWDNRADGNARITIDLSTQYEAWLKKLGLDPVLKYDAKLNKSTFMVRDPELTRFVKIVATSIVQALLKPTNPPNPPPEPPADQPPPEATVPGAVLLITPSKGTPPSQLEVIARLHVTYPVPQKSGPPKTADLINNDLTFVGKPERPR